MSWGPGALKEDLLRYGDALFEQRLHQRAIHVWTRVLFLERGNTEARRRIVRAEAALAERQRELDAEIAEARRLLGEGQVEKARRSVRRVLDADPRHAEAHQLAGDIAALGRRADSRRSPSPSSSAAEARVGAPRAPRSSFSRRRTRPALRGRGGGRTRAGRGPAASSSSASPLKMAGFALATMLVFGSGALYLHLNWESIVSDGAFGTSSPLSPASMLEREAPPVPDTGEIRYYNAERLAAKGRYRDALAELGRIDRGSAIAARARSLTLRIEERLLRGAAEDDPSAGAMRAR